MRKIAVFVEGQSELVAIRSLLLQHFNYVIAFTCLRLYKKGQFGKCPFDYCSPDSQVHYYIYNVGNDNGVINEILSSEDKLWALGFEKIIGLRDMYSLAYRKDSSAVNIETNEKFISINNKTIQSFAKQPKQIHFHYSIMEMETWILGMYELFESIDPSLTASYINENLGYDLSAIDPELTFFNPAQNVADIFALIGKKYDKKLGDIEMLCKHATSAHFNSLYQRKVCHSYNNFFDSLTAIE